MRLLLDSNVIIAALATRGLCSSLFEFCLENSTIILSEDLLEEVEKCLTNKIKVPTQTSQQIISFLRKNTEILRNPGPLEIKICRDPNDIKVLSLAAVARVDCIVTGDKDLLSLKHFQKMTIISPRDLWDRLYSKRPPFR